MNKGLVLVFSGDGKGKTTAAIGVALRTLGRGGRVGVVQFFKPMAVSGERGTGEIKALKKFGSKFRAWSFGGGFTWKMAREENAKAVEKAWEQCCKLLRDPKYDLVIFDEIHIALKYRFLKVADVIQALKKATAAVPDNRPRNEAKAGTVNFRQKMTAPTLKKHVILTGRGAPKALLTVADLVTEMKCLKHPFDRGISSQPGLDF